jgi:hypothetical protein
VDRHAFADAAGRHAMSTMTAHELDLAARRHRALDRSRRLSPEAPPPWLTANVRPAGSFGRADLHRLRSLLDALSANASMVVLDLGAVTLRSHHAAEAIDEAAVELERRGGCLLCINADDEVRAQLGACTHAVVVPGDGFAQGRPTR